MTGAVEQDEDGLFRSIMERFVLPAVKPAPLPPDPEGDARGLERLAEVHAAMRVAPGLEPRMVPGAARKEVHHSLAPL
jgi:hypothetical protein